MSAKPRIKLPIFILLTFLNGLFITSYSQIYDKLEKTNTDSLKQLLPSLSNKEKAETCFQIAKGYFVTEPDSCLKYAELGSNLAKTLQDPEMIARSDFYLGRANFYKGLYEEAILHFLAGFDYYSEKKDTLHILEMVQELSFAYYYSGNYDVLRYFLVDIENKYIPMIRDTMKLSFFITGVGWYYYNLGEYERSVGYYDRFFKMAERFPFPQLIMAHFNKLQGANYAGMDDHSKAIRYYLAANRLYEGLGARSADYELGTSYIHLDSLDKAAYYYQRYLDTAARDKRYYGMGSSFYSLGKIYARQGKFRDAEEAFEKALDRITWVYDHKRNAESMENDLQWNYIAHQSVEKYKEERALGLLSKIHFELYELYDKQDLVRKALDEYIQYHHILDDLNNFEQVAAIEEIRNKYEADKKEQTINLLSQEKAMTDMRLRQSRMMMFALGALLVLAIIVAILFIRMIRIRSVQRSVVLEQKLLRSQMNPHFIFNALSNITNLVEKQDNAAASRYLNRFAKLVRHILESTREDFIMLDDELKNLENYLEIQKLRLSDKFSYSITVDDSIDPGEVLVLPMLIQPFVENSIEHGIKPKDGKGQVAIRFRKLGELITCEVEDDGIGRERSFKIEAVKAGHRSYGVTIAHERLAAMSKKLRRQVKLNILDLRSDAGEAIGTRVVIDMPFKMAV